MKKKSNFSWKKYAEMIYGINRVEELAETMIKEFPKGGSVFLDDYTTEEIEEARKIYDEGKKHKVPNNIKSEIKGVWNGREK
jgi:hypothetical protein